MEEKEKQDMEEKVASYVGTSVAPESEAKIVEKNAGNPFEMQIQKSNAPQNNEEKLGFWAQVKKVLSYIFIDGLSGMAIGLFATLIIGTIVEKIGSFIPGEPGVLIQIVGKFAKFMMGAGIGLGMGYKLKKAPLVSITAGVVGMIASFAGKFMLNNSVSITYGMVGEPLCAFVASFFALEVGSLVSGKTKVDIIVTPLVTIFTGGLVSIALGAPISQVMTWLADIIRVSGQQQPFLMGVLVAVLMGVFLTLPISSAAIGVMLQLDGIVAGAAVVGCCCQMIGFAVMSFRENKWGGLLAQGLGTSMLQMPNLVKKPLLWTPPVIASAILGPIATCALHITSTPAGSGMGTAGLVGVFETFTSMTAGGMEWWLVLIIILGMCVIAPAIICFAISELYRKLGWIKEGDLKLSL